MDHLCFSYLNSAVFGLEVPGVLYPQKIAVKNLAGSNMARFLSHNLFFPCERRPLYQFEKWLNISLNYFGFLKSSIPMF